MKKLFLLISTLFCMSTATFAQQQGEDNGFGLKLHVGITGDKYGAVKAETDIFGISNESDYVESGCKNSPLFGMSIDNRWYVANPGSFGIGIDARWLDFGIGKSTWEEEIAVQGKSGSKTNEYKCTNVQLGMLMPGVVGTFYMGNDMAIDAFYNVGPTVGIYSVSGGEDDDASCEFGLSHFVGAAFRYKVFQAGVEYNIARFKSVDWFDDDEETAINDEDAFFNLGNTFDIETKTKRDNFRIFLGFKF